MAKLYMTYPSGDLVYRVVSFYNIHKLKSEQSKINKFKKELETSRHIMIDSGVFTFMNSGIDFTKEELDNYVSEYIKFIKEHEGSPNVDMFIEIDIGNVPGFGHETTLKYRDQILEAANGKGYVVWHRYMGLDGYIDMCENYDNIALPCVPQVDKMKPEEIAYMSKLAIENNCKVHLLGANWHRLVNMKVEPLFHSADASTYIPAWTYKGIQEYRLTKCKRLTSEFPWLKDGLIAGKRFGLPKYPKTGIQITKELSVLQNIVNINVDATKVGWKSKTYGQIPIETMDQIVPIRYRYDISDFEPNGKYYRDLNIDPQLWPIIEGEIYED